MPLSDRKWLISKTKDEPRNEQLAPHSHFRDNPSFNLLGATGSLKFFNATSAQFSRNTLPQSTDRLNTAQGSLRCEPSEPHRQTRLPDSQGLAQSRHPSRKSDEDVSYLWRSRDNRKGRHAVVLRRRDDGEETPHTSFEPTNTLPATLRGLYALLTRYPYWDISWLAAVVFTLGSVVWILNGFAVVLPQTGQGPSEEMPGITTWSAILGASIFLLGSGLLMLEAINAYRDSCVGCTADHDTPGDCDQTVSEFCPRCESQHSRKMRDGYDTHDADDVEEDGITSSRPQCDCHEDQCKKGGCPAESQDRLLPEGGGGDNARSSAWLPSLGELRTDLIHDIGFVACSIQLFSATLFWLSNFSTIPGASESLHQAVIDCIRWVPQILGGLGFISASILFMLETQPKWYVPAPRVLGWHVGFWKLVGCVGFTLSAALGALGQHGLNEATRQSSISSLWGSWFILLGSLFQLYESLNKTSVVEEGTSQYSEWNESFIRKSEERMADQSNAGKADDLEANSQRRYGSI